MELLIHVKVYSNVKLSAKNLPFG